MAIYHCSIKTFSRAKGDTVVAAAAYRARARLDNEFLGRQENYSKRKDLAHTEIILPAGAPDWATDANKLWNAVEKKETRKNSTVAREFEIALPHELNPQQRQKLAHDISQKLVDRFGFAVQYSIHKPSSDDGINHHVHILASTRKLEASGFTDKTRELDDIKSSTVEQVRETVANTINQHLKDGGINTTVSHKSLADQQADAAAAGDLKKFAELNRAPTVHIGKHPIKSLENTQKNEQIIVGNRQQKREFVDLLKASINPIELRQEAVQTLKAHYQQKLQNLQQGQKLSPVQGSAHQGATADADAQANTGPTAGPAVSFDGDIAALSDQIGSIELQLSLMPPPRTARDFQRRNQLSAQKEQLAGRLKDLIARKADSKKGGMAKPQAPPRFPSAAEYEKQKLAQDPTHRVQLATQKRQQAAKLKQQASETRGKARFADPIGASEMNQTAWKMEARAALLEKQALDLMPSLAETNTTKTPDKAQALAFKPPWADKDKNFREDEKGR